MRDKNPGRPGSPGGGDRAAPCLRHGRPSAAPSGFVVQQDLTWRWISLRRIIAIRVRHTSSEFYLVGGRPDIAAGAWLHQFPREPIWQVVLLVALQFRLAGCALPRGPGGDATLPLGAI